MLSFLMKKLSKISGRRLFLYLNINIPTEFLYISGNLSIRFLLQYGMVDDFLGVFEIILKAIF